MEAPRAPRCGEAFVGATRVDGPLELRGAFPAAAGAGELVEVPLSLVNRGARPFSGVAASIADVYVVKAGSVVAEPLARDDNGIAVDLPPGAAMAFPAAVRLVPCDADPQVARLPLPPGAYQLHATLSVVDDTGEVVVATGGPWTMEVR